MAPREGAEQRRSCTPRSSRCSARCSTGSSPLAKFGVEVIYHAAAYKHVPIVEMNPFTGLQNNTFGGTLTLAEVAKHTGVERFVLVSSDKAVRPTNVMGASKLAELILQGSAEPRVGEPRGGDTIFTMVRFGNVLDSSGSVVRRFRNQIRLEGR